jgi:hypothetical protein
MNVTPNDRRVLEAIEMVCGEWYGFAPHGTSDWTAIRRLERAGLVVGEGFGECQGCRLSHEAEIFVLTESGKLVLHPEEPAR